MSCLAHRFISGWQADFELVHTSLLEGEAVLSGFLGGWETSAYKRVEVQLMQCSVLACEELLRSQEVWSPEQTAAQH